MPHRRINALLKGDVWQTYDKRSNILTAEFIVKNLKAQQAFASVVADHGFTERVARFQGTQVKVEERGTKGAIGFVRKTISKVKLDDGVFIHMTRTVEICDINYQSLQVVFNCVEELSFIHECTSTLGITTIGSMLNRVQEVWDFNNDFQKQEGQVLVKVCVSGENAMSKIYLNREKELRKKVVNYLAENKLPHSKKKETKQQSKVRSRFMFESYQKALVGR